MLTPEKKIQNKIIDFLKTHKDLYYERRQAGGYSYRAGLPDIWFLFKGTHVEVEVKADKGFPSPLQVAKEIELKNAGCLYWRGTSVDDFIAFFNNYFV